MSFAIFTNPPHKSLTKLNYNNPSYVTGGVPSLWCYDKNLMSLSSWRMAVIVLVVALNRCTFPRCNCDDHEINPRQKWKCPSAEECFISQVVVSLISWRYARNRNKLRLVRSRPLIGPIFAGKREAPLFCRYKLEEVALPQKRITRWCRAFSWKTMLPTTAGVS